MKEKRREEKENKQRLFFDRKICIATAKDGDGRRIMFLCARPNDNYIIPARRIAFTTARAAVIQRHQGDAAVYRIFEKNSKPKGAEKFLSFFFFSPERR